MPKLKNFQQYLTEKEDSMLKDAAVSYMFQEVDRNYNNSPFLNSMRTQTILIHEERRDWKDFTKDLELNTEKTQDAKFYMKFEREEDLVEFQIDFTIAYKGVKNFDIPEPSYDYNRVDARLGSSLENITVKRIKMKSNSISYNETKFSKDLNKTVLRLLLNIFKPQFDMIGDEALIIRQL
jgi:hypothetical protein